MRSVAYWVTRETKAKPGLEKDEWLEEAVGPIINEESACIVKVGRDGV